MAPVVAFSAAIPFQGGAGHVNEQWPSYWASIFAANGFVAIDCIRQHVWDDPRVDWFYAQNLLMFCAESALGRYPGLGGLATTTRPLSLVHPFGYESMFRGPGRITVGFLLRRFPAALQRSITVRGRRWMGSRRGP